MSESEISLYKNVFKTKPVLDKGVSGFIEKHKKGWPKHDSRITEIRAIDPLSSKEEEERYNELKKQLPGATISGVFSERHITGIKKHSGLIGLDIDRKKGINKILELSDGVERLKLMLKQESWIFAMIKSVGGRGLAVIVRIAPDSEKHHDAYKALETYFMEKYGLTTDPKCKDVARFRYISIDPDLFVNPDAEVFHVEDKQNKYGNKKVTNPETYKSVERIVEQAVEKRIILGRDDYNSWCDLCFSLSGEFGEAGRVFFHKLSSISEKYDCNECDDQYDKCLNARKRQDGNIEIGTFFHLAKEKGLYQRKATSGYGAEPWQDPIPFDDYSKLPEFPSEILPEAGREMVEAVAKVNQVDKGLPGSMYLSALSTCLSKKVQVDLGTHTEPVNIYTCPILDPGERKTSTMNLMMTPIYKYQEEKAREVLGDKEEPPVYIVDDITSEALFKVMSENNERMSVISAEGGIFGIMSGRYNGNSNGNIDVYLKGHAGDPCSNHRIGRKSQSMDSPSLTICLAVQQDIIREIGSNKQFRGRGLIGRLLFSYCQHKAGYRKRQKEAVQKSLKQEYRDHIIGLMSMPLSPHNLELSPEAHVAWDEFHDDIEAEMQPGKPMASMKDWGSKLAGAVARIAGLLHYAEHGIQATNKSISVNVVNASAVIGAYYRTHALATFGLMSENPEIESAKKILEYLILHKPDMFTGRDVLRHKNALKTMAEVIPGTKLLIERNYIRETNAATFEVNPITKML